jgi:hypothetical protein
MFIAATAALGARTASGISLTAVMIVQAGLRCVQRRV